MDSLRKIFHDGDTDGSGELDLDELHVLIRKHQVGFFKEMGGIHFSGWESICREIFFFDGSKMLMDPILPIFFFVSAFENLIVF